MSEDYAARMQEIQGRLVSQAELTKSHWDDAVAIKYYREHIDWYSGDCLNNFVGKIRVEECNRSGCSFRDMYYRYSYKVIVRKNVQIDETKESMFNNASYYI